MESNPGHKESIKYIGDYQYEATHIIGKGSTSKVYVGRKRDNPTQKYAIKQVNYYALNQKEKKALETEIKIHKSISNPSIATLYATIKENEYMYLVIEYCEGKDLYSYVTSKGIVSEAEMQFMMHSLEPAFNYLRANKIVHRDIKLKNLLRKENKEFSPIKLCDFGTAMYSLI